MRTIKQSTAYELMVFMTDSSDHIAGKTGLTLTITASKAGAAFASITPTVTERGSGWYSLALTTSHCDTLGDFALHITASGADPTDLAMQVRANVLGDTLPANATQVGGENVSSPGTAYPFGVLDQGTAQAATATSLQLRSAVGFADDELIGATILITGGSTGVGQRAIITDYVGATDTATVPTWTVTPTGTITYKIFASAAGMAAADISTAVWAAVTRTLTAGTNIALAKGTGVTGFNDLSAAQVNAEVDTALVDIHLDHLLAADYDPASKPGVATALLNELIESDGGVSRYTANALEQVPTTLDAAAVRAAVGLASANLDTQLADLPTNAELATSQAAADDETIAAIALVPAAVLAAAQADPIHANIEEVNNVQLQGAGTVSNQWRPA